VNGQKFHVEEVEAEGPIHTILVDENQVQVETLKELGRSPLDLLLRVQSRTFHITVEQKDQGELFSVRLNGKPLQAKLDMVDDLLVKLKRVIVQEGPMIVTAPMTGRIASLKTTVGSLAREGQTLVVLEAMKMENEVGSPKEGLVKEIYVQPGALVKAGDKLALVD